MTARQKEPRGTPIDSAAEPGPSTAEAAGSVLIEAWIALDTDISLDSDCAELAEILLP